MKKNIRGLVVAVAIIALITIVILSGRDSSTKRETAPLTADTTGLSKEVPVAGIKLTPTEFQEIINVTGVLEAWNRTLISSETGGRILGWNTELGQKLNAGQVVVQFSDEVAELQWRQAEAALETARIAAEKGQRDYERQKSLYERGDLSDNLIETTELSLKNVEAGLKAAQAAAGLAKRVYEETKVRMPFTGRLSSKLVILGQSVPPGAPVAEVVQTDPIKLVAGISENDIIKVRPGQRVTITTIGWKERVFEGRVFAVGAATDISTRLFPVEISIPNRNLDIKPGMAASAQIIVKTYADALVAPQDAIVDYGKNVTCFIAKGDRAVLRNVEISQPYKGKVMLYSGVQPGDTLITVGSASLKSGQKITLSLEVTELVD